MNYVMFEGHLVSDPVRRQSNDGKEYLTGKIGVWQGKDKNGNDLDSMFIDFVCYGRDAETLSQLAHKGDLILVSGTFKETKNTGNDGVVYTNKQVSGKAKMCYKLAPQNQQAPVTRLPQQNHTQPQQPVYQQPMYQQAPVAQQQNPWGTM